MDQPDREARTQFSQPVRQIMLMLIVLALTAVGCVFAAPRVLPVFIANPYLNGFIFFVFVIGVISCFWQVGQLIYSVRWIEAFVADPAESEDVRAPQLLAPLATLLRSRSRRMQIASSSATSILESVAQRIDEEPVGRVCGDAPGARVGLNQIPSFFQGSQLVAHGGRRHIDTGRRRETAGTDRLGRLDVLPDNRREDGRLSLVEHLPTLPSASRRAEAQI